MLTPGDLLKPREVARLLRVTLETVYVMLERRDFPGALSRKAGRSRRWLIPRSDVLALLETCEPARAALCEPRALTREELLAACPELRGIY